MAGQLRVALIDGFLPEPTDTFLVVNTNSLVGAFDNVANGHRLLTTDGRGTFLVVYGAASPFDPTQVVLSAFEIAAGIPGDYNNDGIVDAADYTLRGQQ